MRIDCTSLFVNSKVIGASETCSWGTSIGQSTSNDCRIKTEKKGTLDLITGMLYSAVAIDADIDFSAGSGVRDILMCSLFKKVYVNGILIPDTKMLLWIVREHSDHHENRKLLCYAKYVKYHNEEINAIALDNITKEICESPNGCWFAYDIEIKNQDELHLSVIIVNTNGNQDYAPKQRSKKWNDLIESKTDSGKNVSIDVLAQYLVNMVQSGISYPYLSFGYKYSQQLESVSSLKLIDAATKIDPSIKNSFAVEIDKGKNLFKFQELPYLSHTQNFDNDQKRQIIYYGAPGTGKSHDIEQVCKKYKHYRTTFHPDSDYSTFVGAYKPVREIVEKFDTTGHYIKYQEGPQKGKVITEERITYKFVPQAFMQAYIEAWKRLSDDSIEEEDKKVFLIIEEINRGNCAQIFGDLFQLLDRNEEGYSDYEILADNDIKDYIKSQGLKIEDLIDSNGNDIYDNVNNGELLVLPPNLYIWATMNTSDQSLFPIDSAFKRRWCMKYVPINPEKENWAIEVGSRLCSWSSFLDKINFEIGETTRSEDKKLGFYFCKADKKAKDSDDEPTIITLENFTSKVLFYIYNDVFKDYGHEREFFKDKENGQKKIEFENFYDYNGEIKAESVEKLLDNLDVDVFDNSEADDNEEQDEDTNNSHHNYLKSVTIDDEVFSSDELTKFDVYIKSLQKIGLDKVVPIIEKSKYKRLNCPLASKQQYDAISQSKSFSYVEIDGYQFVKGVSDDTLINILNEIKSVLNLSFSIQIYN